MNVSQKHFNLQHTLRLNYKPIAFWGAHVVGLGGGGSFSEHKMRKSFKAIPDYLHVLVSWIRGKSSQNNFLRQDESSLAWPEQHH